MAKRSRSARGRSNPSGQLVSYKSSVAVGDPGLSPLEATLVLGGLLAVAAGAVYFWARSTASTVGGAAPGVQPVPLPVPAQPVPGAPGY